MGKSLRSSFSFCCFFLNITVWPGWVPTPWIFSLADRKSTNATTLAPPVKSPLPLAKLSDCNIFSGYWGINGALSRPTLPENLSVSVTNGTQLLLPRPSRAWPLGHLKGCQMMGFSSCVSCSIGMMDSLRKLWSRKTPTTRFKKQRWGEKNIILSNCMMQTPASWTWLARVIYKDHKNSKRRQKKAECTWWCTFCLLAPAAWGPIFQHPDSPPLLLLQLLHLTGDGCRSGPFAKNPKSSAAYGGDISSIQVNTGQKPSTWLLARPPSHQVLKPSKKGCKR